MSYYENYCMECDWSASKRNHSTNELAALAIDHAVSTGHDIDSRDDSDDSGGFEIEAGGTGSEGVVSSLEHTDY